MTESTFDLVVIGAGPGGYPAAIRAAQLGMTVACVEKEPALGGTCLRIGCIPSKALLEASEKYEEAAAALARFGVRVADVQLDLAAMMKHKDRTVQALTKGVAGLFKKNGIQRFEGLGRLDGPGRVRVLSAAGEEQTLQAKYIILATGSDVATLPFIEMDGRVIGSSTEALAYDPVPEHLVVIGAGVIGLELGSVWRRLGSRVTCFEIADRILPGLDLEVAKAAEKQFRRQGITFHLGRRVTAVRRDGEEAVVEAEGLEPVRCSRVLVAVGRRPYTEGLGLETVGIDLDRAGRIPVDEHFQTRAAGVYAIGDVIAGPMLAHKAEEEGIACVESIATGYGHVNYDAIPSVVYTHPGIASVGSSEEALKEAGIPYRKGVFFFRANGRARAAGNVEGFVKMLAHAETDRILGVHIIGPHAGELIAEAALAIEFGASSEDVARSVHAHPTLAETLKEAALAVDGRAIHA